MSLTVKKGVITLPTSAGSVVVTGVGFQGAALILWSTRQTATGFANGAALNVGLAASASQRYCASVTALDATAAGSATSTHKQENTRCLIASMTAGGSTEMDLDFASWGADGFTLTLATPAGTPAAYLVHYLVIGGSDIAGAYVGNAAPTSGTGSKTISGVGFQPDCVLMIDTVLTTIGSPFSNGNLAVSAFTGSQAMSSQMRVRDSLSPTETLHYQVAKAIGAYASAADTLDHEATGTMNADGFALNYTTRASANQFGFLALKGGQYDVRAETQKTSTGTKATTGLGFTPTGLLLVGTNGVSSASVQLDSAKLSIGASDGTTEGCAYAGATDAVTTSETRSVTKNDKILAHATNPSTVNAEADLSSFDASTGYTLNWSTADATAREFWGLAMGSNPAAGGGGGGRNAMLLGVG